MNPVSQWWKHTAIALATLVVSLAGAGLNDFTKRVSDHEDRLRKVENAFVTLADDAKYYKEMLERMTKLIENNTKAAETAAAAAAVAANPCAARFQR